MRESLIVFTAVVGNYDRLGEHVFSDIPAMCFTDNETRASRGWMAMPIKANWKSVDERVRTARKYKILSHAFLPDHSISVWIDGNLTLSANPESFLESLRDADIATFKYPRTYGARDCIYEEALACRGRNKDKPDVIDEQVRRYKREGYPEHAGLVETSILIRRNSAKVRRFNIAWWNEVYNGSRRDQLSFNYVCWKTGTRYAHLPGSRIDNPLARWTSHVENIYL